MLETLQNYQLEPERQAMTVTRPTLAEALGLLARKKGYFSDRPETFALAALLQRGMITIDQIESKKTV